MTRVVRALLGGVVCLAAAAWAGAHPGLGADRNAGGGTTSPPGAGTAGDSGPGGLSVEPLRYRIRLEVPGRVREAVLDLRARGFDVFYADAKTGVVELVGDDVDFAALAESGYHPAMVPEPSSPSAVADYLSPDEIASKLAWYEQTYPTLARRIAYATDHQGRPAYALKVSDNVTVDEDEPAVLFVAQHHAREVMTPEVAIDIVDQLLAGYGVDPSLTRAVNGAEIWVVGSHNPDGAAQVFVGNTLWRKNRRDNGDGTFGVDLNRNYPFAWNRCNGSSGDTGSDSYRGPSAGSEPTTVGLIDLARRERPVFFVTYHTTGEFALHPYGCSDTFAAQPDGLLLREMASEVSAVMDGDVPGTWYRFGTPWELLYDVDGDSDGWLYGELGAFGVTFELNANGQGFQPDYATWRDSTVHRARPGWRYFLDALSRGRLTGHVVDACTGAPLPGAQIALAEQVQTNGETPRTSGTASARYDWPVRPGRYTLQISRSGYAPQSWPTEVGVVPVAREVALVPSAARALAVSSARIVDPDGDADGQADPDERLDLWPTAYATGGAVSGVTATFTSDDPYVTILEGAAAFGSLAAGQRVESLDPVTLRIAADAPDGHEIVLRANFGAAAALCAPTSAFALRVTRGVPATSYIAELLDADPRWRTEDSHQPGWTFGPPAEPGPAAAYTGQHVYGINLGGRYADNATYALVAGPFDLTGLRAAELRFARFLRSEPGFDIARVQVRSAAHPGWTTVWQGFGRDTAWLPVRYDVSGVADGAREVYVRFTLESDGDTTDAGFYVDDVVFAGEALPGALPRVKFTARFIDDGDPAYGNANKIVDPNESVRMQVVVTNVGGSPATGVSAILTTATPGVTVNDAVATFPDLAGGQSSMTFDPHFSFTTGAICGTSIAFHLTTRWDGGRAESDFTVPVGVLTETALLAADMESEAGWTPGGDARSGQFVRGDPNGVVDPTAGPIQPEDDATPAPGTACWVTGNPPVVPGYTPRSGDVDRGSAWLRSPVFDGTGAGSLLVRYARFFHRSALAPLDVSTFRAEMSADGGATWTTLETLEANAAAWNAVEVDATDLVPGTAAMALRFSATETARTPADPLTELLVDDVRVVRRTLTCDPFTPVETSAPGPVGASLRAARAGTDVALSWSAPAADENHAPARFYPVYRSGNPSSGYTLRGEAIVTAWKDPDGAAAGLGSFFYVAAARNAAGDSGETP